MEPGNLANASKTIKKILNKENAKLLSFLTNQGRLQLARILLARLKRHENLMKARDEYRKLPWYKKRPFSRPKLNNIKVVNYSLVSPTNVRTNLINVHKRVATMNNNGRGTLPNYSLSINEQKQLNKFISMENRQRNNNKIRIQRYYS